MIKFDAFISYRHQDVDDDIIETLQKKLERLKKSDGKYLSVFRDTTDFSATNDLDAGIKEKLKNSRYLIILCTPGYSESIWCMKELRYFRQIHGNSNEHILTILLEGEPMDVFPEELLWEDRIGCAEDGQVVTVRTKTVPLAADIRGDSRKKMLHRLRTEYLRVAAPLLGKSYDEVYRRQRRWQWTLWGSIGGMILLCSVLFALYNQIMLNQIAKEHQTMLANESRRLAEAAEKEIDGENSNLALLLALEALPKDLNEPERPIVPEAEVALRSAVYSRLIQGEVDLLQNIARIDFSTINWESNSALFDNFSKLYCVAGGSLSIYDTGNGMLLLEAPMGVSGNFELNWSMTHVLVSASNSYNVTSIQYSIYEIATGQMVYQNAYEYSYDYPYDITVTWDPEKDICYFLSVADDREPILLDAVFADGTPAPEVAISSDQLDEWNRRNVFDFPAYPLNKLNPADYRGSDGPLTDMGVRYQSVIEKKRIDSNETVYISKDESLMIINSSVYSLKDASKYVRLEGGCVVDELNHRLYVTQDTSLLIYSYEPERESSGIIIDRISNDGQLAVGSISGEGPMYLWEYHNLTEPLLQLSCKSCYLTADMRYVLMVTGENTLQLWHAYQGLIVEIPLQEEKPLMPCVNADGSLLAVVCFEQQTVDVYSSNGELVRRIPIPMQHNRNKENYSEVTQLEFEGSKLLISCYGGLSFGYTQIWDIASGDEPVTIADYSGNENTESQECLLTSDGLLFCVGTVFGDAVDTIYDLETGEAIFQQTAFCRYDEDSGVLIYAPVGPQFPDINTIHAARRDETGMFRDLYTFETELGNFSMRYSVQAMDSDYFLLNDGGVCEAYKIATGESVMTIRTGLGYEDLFHIVDGVIYHTSYYSDATGRAFPMMDLPELVEMAKAYLTSDTGVRTLTNAEKVKFYIE